MRLLLILLLTISLQAQVVIRPISPHTIGGGGGSSYDIEDTFTSNTSANYTNIKDGFTWDTGNGWVYGSNDWATNWSYHETSVTSNDHWIEGEIRSVGNYRAGLIVRCNGTTGYMVYLSSTNNRIYLHTFDGTTMTEVTNFTAVGATMTDDRDTWMKVTISGTSIDVDVDINGDGDYLDTGEGMTTWTNSTYSTGTYVGIYMAMDAAQPPYIKSIRADH